MPEGERPERLTEEQLACIGVPEASRIREIQAADPAADARREAGKGEFGLLRFETIGAEFAPGLACAFDLPSALARGSFSYLDYSGRDSVYLEASKFYELAQLRYAAAYNGTLASHKGFPHWDICRQQIDKDKGWFIYRDLNEFRRKPTRRGSPKSLHEAVRRHDGAGVRRFLKQGADPNEVDVWGLTPLGWAVLTGRADVMRSLIAAGADPNRHREGRASFDGGPTPLILAINVRSLKLVRQLARAGADVNLKSPAYRAQDRVSPLEIEPQGGPPLLAAVILGELKIARFLLENGADPDIWGSGQAPLHAAVRDGRRELVSLLLKHGADVQLRGDLGLSAIQMAAGRKRHEAIIRMIAEAGGLADAHSRAERALWRAALEQGRLEILGDLIAFGAHAHLLKSAERERLRALITDDRRKEVLDLLALSDRRAEELESAIKAGDLERVKAAYTDGAEIAEGRMRTGLVLAVEARRPKLVAWYLEQGADPLAPVYHAVQFWQHRKFPVRMTALREEPAILLAFEYGPIDSVRLLIENVDASGNMDKPWRRRVLRSALDGYAGGRRFRALTRMVKSEDEISNLVEIDLEGHQDPEIVDVAVDLSGGISKRGPEADSFLGEVCRQTSQEFSSRQGGAELLKRYLEKGYRPRQVDDPPFTARNPGDYQAVYDCLDAGARQALLIVQHGADPNEPGGSFGSSLMDALHNLYRDPDYLKVIEELLKRGADPNRPNKYGLVVLDWANPSPEILELHVFSALYFGSGERPKGEEEFNRRFEQMQEELRKRYAAARRLLMKYGARTRAQLEKEGVLEPLPKREPKPEARIPVR